MRKYVGPDAIIEMRPNKTLFIVDGRIIREGPPMTFNTALGYFSSEVQTYGSFPYRAPGVPPAVPITDLVRRLDTFEKRLGKIEEKIGV